MAVYLSYFSWKFLFLSFFPMWVILNWVSELIYFLCSSLVLIPAAMFVSYFNNLGSHVICAPLSGVLVSTISLYVVQHVSQVLVNMRSPYRLTGRSICWSTLNWYVRQYIGQHSTASPQTCQLIRHPIHDQYIYWSTLGRYGECQSSVEYWSTVSGILIEYWWHIGRLSYNIIRVWKSEWGSWVSVLRVRYHSSGIWK